MPIDTAPLYAASPQLTALRDEILPHYAGLNYVDSDDDAWGATTAAPIGIIETANDDHLDCCLAHELLHLWLQSRGYRRLRRGISSFDDTGWFGQFVSALDNELQHHRMFPRYQAMGLNPVWFYGSSDQHTAANLNAALANPARDIKSTVLDYLTCIAPGGQLTADQTAEFKQRFHEDRDGEYDARLTAIDQAFAAWRSDGAKHTLNAEQIVRHIMQALDNGAQSWFGYGPVRVFPENGFFVGAPFEMEED